MIPMLLIPSLLSKNRRTTDSRGAAKSAEFFFPLMPRRAACALIASSLLPAAAPPPKDSVDVFTSGQDGYHTYRIPAIVQTRKGTLLAFCEGRKSGQGDAGNIDLLLKRSTDRGRTWSQIILIADFGSDTVGNPAPVVDRRTGTIWLLHTSNPGDVPEKQIEAGLTGPTRTVWVTHSKDDGLTWAKSVDITASVKKPEWTWYATGPVNGIQLRSGRMVIPSDHNRGDATERYSHVIYSDDSGKTWKLGGSAGPHCNESTIVELRDGSLMLNMRSYHGKNRRAVSISKDGGLTFSEPVLDDALIEPVCQASLLRVGEGKSSVLLFANPAGTKRVNMTVRLSRDDGKTWIHSKSLHPGPSAYSNLIAITPKLIGLLYEKGESSPYERITFDRFGLDWLTQ
ncbi:MAG: sialidase family protein [Bryobacteraceae bacterium]